MIWINYFQVFQIHSWIIIEINLCLNYQDEKYHYYLLMYAN